MEEIEINTKKAAAGIALIAIGRRIVETCVKTVNMNERIAQMQADLEAMEGKAILLEKESTTIKAEQNALKKQIKAQKELIEELTPKTETE